uniref:Translocase of outer mitochondrial membrane 34 n=1 Tax=Cyprinodon variegatus TaxID=28743 RepID=A0A3Q2CK20_CYPVA
QTEDSLVSISRPAAQRNVDVSVNQTAQFWRKAVVRCANISTASLAAARGYRDKPDRLDVFEALLVFDLLLRMTKALTEADGPSWREKLPPIPTVPLSVREKLAQQAAANQAQHDKDVKKAQALKEEGNALVKKGEYQKAVEKYTQSLKHNGSEVTTYTNRALCFLSLKQYRDAIRDCSDALRMDGSNVKALYRRAQAHKELKDIKACVDDLNSLLKVEPKNTAALKLLQEVQKK